MVSIDTYKKEAASALMAYQDVFSIKEDNAKKTIDWDNQQEYPNAPPKKAIGAFAEYLRQVKLSNVDVYKSFDRLNSAFTNYYPTLDFPCPDCCYRASDKMVNVSKLFLLYGWIDEVAE